MHVTVAAVKFDEVRTRSSDISTCTPSISVLLIRIAIVSELAGLGIMSPGLRTNAANVS